VKLVPTSQCVKLPIYSLMGKIVRDSEQGREPHDTRRAEMWDFNCTMKDGRTFTQLTCDPSVALAEPGDW
jgi:hypothetical protein